MIQIQYLEKEGALERTLCLFARKRGAGHLPSQERLAEAQVTLESTRTTHGKKRQRRIPYRVTEVLLYDTNGARQRWSLWLTPTSTLAEQIEALVRGDDAQGGTIDAIRLRWPEGSEERYERYAAGSKTFVRAA